MQYVDQLQNEDGELPKLMGWLSGQEALLGMTIAAFKHFAGQALGSDKVGECSCEREGKIGNSPVLPQTTSKIQFAPKSTQLPNSGEAKLVG
jgi:hypothetical protein